MSLRARAPTRLLALGGEPMDGPRHIWWNFVSSSQDRIEQAKADWKSGRSAWSLATSANSSRCRIVGGRERVTKSMSGPPDPGRSRPLAGRLRVQRPDRAGPGPAAIGRDGAAPPGGAASQAPAPQSGHYAGTGFVMRNQGTLCAQQIRVTNFVVNGNRVSFGAYRGTIQPDGSLHMQAGPTYVYGQFVGSHFDGRFWRPPPGCTYDLSLDPVG